MLYNPWVTRDMCRLFPDLKLTADFSHFCVVAERVFAEVTLTLTLTPTVNLTLSPTLILTRYFHADP